MLEVVQPETWKIIGDYAGKSWVWIGPLVGVWFGVWATGRRQRREWLADSKKEEYRELLKALSDSLAAYMRWSNEFVHDSNAQREFFSATPDFFAVLRSRLFIAKETERLRVLQRWFDLSQRFEHKKDYSVFGDGVNQLIKDIQEAALKDVSQ